MNPLRAGFTLLEIMIATMMLALLIAAAGTALDQGERMSERIALENELTDKVNRILNDLAMELRTADADPNNLWANYSGQTSPHLKTPTLTQYGSEGYYKYQDLLIYQYRISTGIQQVGGKFTGKMESTCHRIVYDPWGGTLTKELWSDYQDGAGNYRMWKVILADQLVVMQPTVDPKFPRGGFFIDQVGNTLAMQLAVFSKYRVGYDGEQIVKVANSQVLFLRSTLDTNLGSAAYNRSDANFQGDAVNSQSPQIFFGHLITFTGSTYGANSGEVSIFMQPPVGQRLDPTTAVVTVNTYDALGNPNAALTMTENTGVSDGAVYTNLIRITRPDKNGNVTVSLVNGPGGAINGSFTVNATVKTTTGLQTNASKTY
jgi:prepilin-type N-terminal cleavage/methylation domain-containing protein